MIWRCPNCQKALSQGAGGWRCQTGHSFDKARQGYVNLLLANQRNSKDPGDNRAMVAGRRAFLHQGHYHPLVTAMARILDGYYADTPQSGATSAPLTLLDLGCGEGYYLDSLRQAWALMAGRVTCLNGLDISREAVKRAATLLPQAQFCVASSYRIPAADACVDIVLQVFAPVAEAEVARILKPGGVWLRVSPGPRHLYQLKAALYSRAREHSQPSVPDNFSLLAETQVGFTLVLEGEQAVASLLAMTPFGWHGSAEGHRQLAGCTSFQADADFILQLMTVGSSDV